MLCRPVVLIMVVAATVLSTEQMDKAQDCHLYHLNKTTTNKTPLAHLHHPHLLTLSLWVGEEGGWPDRFSVHLQPDKVNIHFTEDGSATVRIEHTILGGPQLLDKPRPPAHSWLTLSLSIRDHTLILYRPEQPYRTLAVPYSPSAGQQFTAFVSTDQEIHVAFNCQTVCIIHNANSPLLGVPDLLHPSFTLYLRPESPEDPQYLTLNTSNTHTHKGYNFTGKPGVWSKVNVTTNSESAAAGGERVLEVLPNQTFTITAVENLLWSLYCHPGDPEEWITTTTPPIATLEPQTPDSNSGGTDISKSQEEGGAGAGEVTAWVLAGLALAGVVVLALALCTRMAPQDNPPDDDNDYNMASVGYLSHRFDGGREAEEGSEPTTPVLTLAPEKDIY